MSRVVQNTEFNLLLEETNKRIVKLVADMPNDQKAFFRIEKIRVLEKWPEFYERMHAIRVMLRKETVLEYPDYSKLLFYVQLMGQYYAADYNTDVDIEYSVACDLFVRDYFVSEDLTSEHLETLFFNAFPEAKAAE